MPRTDLCIRMEYRPSICKSSSGQVYSSWSTVKNALRPRSSISSRINKSYRKIDARGSMTRSVRCHLSLQYFYFRRNERSYPSGRQNIDHISISTKATPSLRMHGTFSEEQTISLPIRERTALIRI